MYFAQNVHKKINMNLAITNIFRTSCVPGTILMQFHAVNKD